MASMDENRRDFLRGLAGLPAVAAAAAAEQQPPVRKPELFNAIQMGPQTILDGGIDRCLDLIQETAGINALMIYSHTYHGDIRKPPQMLAPDHGVPPREMRGRKLPAVWVKHNEQSFQDTTLRHQRPVHAGGLVGPEAEEAAHRRRRTDGGVGVALHHHVTSLDRPADVVDSQVVRQVAGAGTSGTFPHIRTRNPHSSA